MTLLRGEIGSYPAAVDQKRVYQQQNQPFRRRKIIPATAIFNKRLLTEQQPPPVVNVERLTVAIAAPFRMMRQQLDPIQRREILFAGALVKILRGSDQQFHPAVTTDIPGLTATLQKFRSIRQTAFIG